MLLLQWRINYLWLGITGSTPAESLIYSYVFLNLNRTKKKNIEIYMVQHFFCTYEE